MTADDEPESSLGETLVAAGWRQGSLFKSRSLRFTCAVLNSHGESDASIVSRAKNKGDTFVLASQTCDVVSAYQTEPYVEALLCQPETNGKLLVAADQNSARWFLVDPAANLVVWARYRIVIDKLVLATLTPEPWPGDTARLDWFVRWLARRYDRPAIPDTLVDALQRPAEAAVRDLAESDPGALMDFTNAVREIRVTVPAELTLPYRLQLVVLLKEPSLTREGLHAVETVMTAVRASLDSRVVSLHPDDRILSPEEISLAEFLATRPLFLEYLTYRGETSADAALPVDRA